MSQKQLEQEKINQLLDAHSDSYDAATLSRLRQGREQALQALDKKPQWFIQPLPVAFASVCLLALSVGLFNYTFVNKGEQQLVANEVLLDDNLASVLLTDELDIEFYEWLDQSDEG